MRADVCLELVLAHPREVADWDAPFAHEALARALAATGDPAGARGHRGLAVDLTGRVADPLDRDVLVAAMAGEPWFGLDAG